MRLSGWPVVRQIRRRDLAGLGATAMSRVSETLEPHTRRADRIVRSVCPYCAVGCGQLVHVRDGRVVNVEGDPDSPISQGCLCPKGAATSQLVTGDHRLTKVLHRAPYAREWAELGLEQAMDMVAERVKHVRDQTWQESDTSRDPPVPLRRTMAIAHLGGATLDAEENYLIKKLWTALGVVQVENQARI